MQCKIIRTVNGHFADPNSTRDLSQISAEELEHIRMSCEAGMLEAETYLAMADDELKATFERTLRTVTEVGLCDPMPVPEIDAELRGFLRTRYEACCSLLRKLVKSSNSEVRGITPLEFEHMVTSLQAGYREAEVCCALSHDQIAAAFRAAVAVRERLGLGFDNPYPAGWGDWVEFFLERSEVLWDVLGRVNVPY